MTADPCGAPVSGGTYGTVHGTISRVHSSVATDLYNAGDGAGFMLWVPAFTGTASNNSAMNLVRYQVGGGLGPEDSPVNTTTTCFGGGSATGGYAVADPAYALITTDLVSDARSLAACMSVHTTGKAQDNNGEFAVLTSLSLRDVIDDDDSSIALTPDSIFNAATSVSRVGMNKVEALFTPPNEGKFYDEHSQALTRGQDGTNLSALFVNGRIEDPQVIVIAWRNVTSSVPVTFNFTKVIEWRPKTIGNIGHAKPRVLSRTSLVGSITQQLNARSPGWDARIGDALSAGLYSAGTHLAQKAVQFFTGVPKVAYTAIGPLPAL